MFHTKCLFYTEEQGAGSELELGGLVVQAAVLTVTVTVTVTAVIVLQCGRWFWQVRTRCVKRGKVHSRIGLGALVLLVGKLGSNIRQVF